MIREEKRDLDYYRINAEKDYMKVPISVLRYISELEEVVKKCSVLDIVAQSEQLPNMTLQQAIEKARLNMEKIKDVDMFIDDIKKK